MEFRAQGVIRRQDTENSIRRKHTLRLTSVFISSTTSFSTRRMKEFTLEIELATTSLAWLRGTLAIDRCRVISLSITWSQSGVSRVGGFRGWCLRFGVLTVPHRLVLCHVSGFNAQRLRIKTQG